MAVRNRLLRQGSAVVAGLVWALVAIALRVLVLPDYLPLSAAVAQGRWYRLASWTLLAPLTLASSAAPSASAPGSGPLGSLELPAWRLGLSLAVGVGLCLLAARLLGHRRSRTVALCGLVLFAALGTASAAAVTLQLRDAVQGERSFFTLLSGVEVAHRDAATVAGARDFARRYPDSRWAGEALRIVAMAEWDAGRIDVAARQWEAFASRFQDRSAPGVAYAEYNLALCDERLGREAAAGQHLRTAIETIRIRGDGIQSWIAAAAAERLASLEGIAGRYSMAGYWNTKSRTFANVYSTE
jgi:hypothetical protein